MKTKFTLLSLLAMVFFVGSGFLSNPIKEKNEPASNFRYIDDFNANTDLWWTPEGSGSTAGIILMDGDQKVTFREHNTTTVNPATGSTGSMRLVYKWDDAKPYTGTASHLIRQHMPAGNANVVARRFAPGQALEVFVHGDGSGHKFRFMTRDGVPQLEGSQWVTVDWTGWKRITWNYNKPENVVGWVNGNGIMEKPAAADFYFDSFQITWAEGTPATGELFFDDFRIVDPFNVTFVVKDEADNLINDAIIAVDGAYNVAGDYAFKAFPGDNLFFVQKTGFETYINKFVIDDQDITLDVVLKAGAPSKYDVNFSVIAGENLLEDATITFNGITNAPGDYKFEAEPGFYSYSVIRPGYHNNTGMVTVTDAVVFVNALMNVNPAAKIDLTWHVAVSGTTPEKRTEYYSVWVAEVTASGDKAINPADFVMIYEETIDENVAAGTFIPRSADLSMYRDKTIQVAFRHHKSTDKDQIMVDNVKIEGLAIGTAKNVIFMEDFQGGVADPVNPAWLPAAWTAIDADDDGKNWFFAVDETKGYMVSASADANGALTPDNWLFSPEIVVPFAYYNVTFVVKDDATTPANVADAIVKIGDVVYPANKYVIPLVDGDYNYEVSKAGYKTATGNFKVEGAAQSINVTLELIPIPKYDVTFTVNMQGVSGFTPGTTKVYIAGNFLNSFAQPGTLPEQELNASNENIYIFSRTYKLEAGTYTYKYFKGTAWADGEWEGEPNRIVVVVDQNVSVSDKFGVKPGTSTSDIMKEAKFRVFPNPANSLVNVSSESRMKQVMVYNLAGQEVYNQAVDTYQHSFETGSFQNGIYMVRIVAVDGMINTKLQIAK